MTDTYLSHKQKNVLMHLGKQEAEKSELMPQLRFGAASAQNKGRELHTTFDVEGGEIDTTVVEVLNNVTLTHQGGGRYLLVIEADSQHAKALRNAMVYNALMRKFCEGDDRPFNRLVQYDKDERST